MFGTTRMYRLALLGLCLTVAGVASAQPPGSGDEPKSPEPTSQEMDALWSLVDGLFTAVRAGNDAALDHATCLDEWLFDHMERERALGLLDHEPTPDEVDTRRAEARGEVKTFVRRLEKRGGEIEWIDFSRLVLDPDAATDPEDEAAEELASETGEDVAITGHGVLAVKMLTQERPQDIEISRIGDRWCLNPLSMQ